MGRGDRNHGSGSTTATPFVGMDFWSLSARGRTLKRNWCGIGITPRDPGHQQMLRDAVAIGNSIPALNQRGQKYSFLIENFCKAVGLAQCPAQIKTTPAKAGQGTTRGPGSHSSVSVSADHPSQERSVPLGGDCHMNSSSIMAVTSHKSEKQMLDSYRVFQRGTTSGATPTL